MVTLSLLVLLTVAALSMSKNSFKEIRTSGFMRQGAMAKNVADSGLQWSVYWIDTAASSDSAASDLISVKNLLARDNMRSGRIWGLKASEYKPGGSPDVKISPPSANPDFNANLEPDYEQGFTIGLTRMGKLPVTGISQGAGAGAFTPAAGGQMMQAPDLWAIRSEAQIKPVSANITFTHTKEAWVSTPVR